MRPIANKQSPLNRGLLSWWLIRPDNIGGESLTDLMGREDGTLTNMDLSSSWYGGSSGRPGQAGSLETDGTNDYVDCGQVPTLPSGSVATVSAWVYRPTTGTTASFGFYLSPYRLGCVWYSDDNLYVYCEDGSAVSRSVNLSFAGWNHVVLSFDGSRSATERVNVYVNGLLRPTTGGTPAYSTTIGTPSERGAFRLGSDYQGGNRYWAGQYDDARVYNRALSGTEAYALYKDSRTGYRKTLVQSRSSWLPAGGGGGGGLSGLVDAGLVDSGLVDFGLVG